MNDYLAQIVLSIVGLAVLSILVFVWWAWSKKISPWLDVRLTATQRELIDRLAKDGYVWVEKNFAGSGREKFEAACEWLSLKAAHIGLKIPAEEIEAAAQKAWEEFNANKTKLSDSVVFKMNEGDWADDSQADQIVEKINAGLQDTLENAMKSVVDPKS